MSERDICPVCGQMYSLHVGPCSQVLQTQEPRGNITFHGPDDLEMLRLEPDGRIFVFGREAATDLEVVDTMREFLRMCKL